MPTSVPRADRGTGAQNTRMRSRACTVSSGGRTPAYECARRTGSRVVWWRGSAPTSRVVAVATERQTFDWTAAVLAIFKAGGVYLPSSYISRPIASRARFRPRRLPAGADRGRQHRDPGPGPGSLPEVRALDFEPPTGRVTPATTWASRSSPDQLAYIYFTSGSTGEPKGAMCEHAGQLNHLYAKIADLEPRRGPGGRPDRAAVLRHLAVAADLRAAGRRADPAGAAGGDPRRRAVRRPARRRSGRGGPAGAVLPGGRARPTWSSILARCRTCAPCRSPARRSSRADPALVRHRPGTSLVNAYGLTETSDDTNHEAMRRAPEAAGPAGPRCRTSASTSSTRTWCRCLSAPPA